MSARIVRSKPQSDRRRSLVLFGLAFMLFGCLFTYLILVRPLLKVQAARTWKKASAVVSHSKVASHSDSDGATSSVDIVYTYEVLGRKYSGNRYDFTEGSSSGYHDKKIIVDRYSPGRTFKVFYDPLKPSESVINREFPNMIWVGLFPIVFVMVGLAVMISGVRRRQKSISAQLNAQPEKGPLEFRPGRNRIMKVFGFFFLALFWNGFVFVFLAIMVMARRLGEEFICDPIFLIPFVLVGLGLIAVFIYNLMQLFNPKIIISLSRSLLRLGDAVSCRFTVQGRSKDRLRHLSIELIGWEEAEYQRGSSSYTDKKEFCKVPLLNLDLKNGVMNREFQLRIPAESMHSFKAPNNRVIWTLLINGDIPKRPNVKDKYELTIFPSRRRA